MSEEQISPRPGTPGVRASDEDRERLIAELNEHTVAGRLSTEDLEQRVQQAYAARTTSDLDALRRDLPITARQAAVSHAARRSHLTRRLIQETGGSAALFVLCTAVWLASGAHGQFWPVWVLIVVVLSAVRSAWALYGPAPDLDAVESNLNARNQQRQARHQSRSERRSRRRH
jgi:uncharacterized protein DUF1707